MYIIFVSLTLTSVSLLFQVRGKDLPGAVKVMPMGLDAAIRKRVSGEFRSEVSTRNTSVKGTVAHAWNNFL